MTRNNGLLKSVNSLFRFPKTFFHDEEKIFFLYFSSINSERNLIDFLQKCHKHYLSMTCCNGKRWMEGI